MAEAAMAWPPRQLPRLVPARQRSAGTSVRRMAREQAHRCRVVGLRHMQVASDLWPGGMRADVSTGAPAGSLHSGAWPWTPVTCCSCANCAHVVCCVCCVLAVVITHSSVNVLWEYGTCQVMVLNGLAHPGLHAVHLPGHCWLCSPRDQSYPRVLCPCGMVHRAGEAASSEAGTPLKRNICLSQDCVVRT